MIVLENKNYSDTFGTSTQDPYLQKTLVPMGALLSQYYGTGHVSLDNYISMISGQAPNLRSVRVERGAPCPRIQIRGGGLWRDGWSGGGLRTA